MVPSPLVVVGASLGGVEALQRLAAGLPDTFEAPLLVVLHVGAHKSVLPRLLEQKSKRPAVHPQDGDVIRPGRIYVAPPDNHMLVDGAVIRLTRGPKEHHTRPAIDPLFRSAALSRGRDVVGLVMTGALDDGTAGLQAIKACGGRAVVQDPSDTVEPSMPKSALAWVDVDLTAPLDELPVLLARLVAHPNTTSDVAAHDQVACEQKWFLGQGDTMEHMRNVATPSAYVCPDCRGALWEVSGSRPSRFRCHTGHAYTLRTLYDAQFAQTDEALWGAVRALQEQELVLQRLAEEGPADAGQAAELHSRRVRAREHAEVLRRLIEPS